VSNQDPTDEELREFEEALERARAAGMEIVEGDDRTTTVFFVGPEQLERMKHLFED
jgi:hypothetical protein